MTPSPHRLDGQVAVVTGGGGDIGAAVSCRFSELGATVAVLDRDVAAAGRTADQLPGPAESFEVDVTSSTDVKRVCDEIARRHGRIDILATAAGFSRDARITEMDDDMWESVIRVCLFAPFACSRAVAPHMITRSYGRIIHIASRAYLGNPGQANYSAAKAGVIGMTKALAKELGRYDITANVVSPGFINTKMTAQHPKYAAIATRAIEANSVRRVGHPDDVAAAFGYLATPAASYITGDVIHVAGGRFG